MLGADPTGKETSTQTAQVFLVTFDACNGLKPQVAGATLLPITFIFSHLDRTVQDWCQQSLA